MQHGRSLFITYEGGHYNRLALVLVITALLIALFSLERKRAAQAKFNRNCGRRLDRFPADLVFSEGQSGGHGHFFDFSRSGFVFFNRRPARLVILCRPAHLPPRLVSAAVIGFHLSLGDMFKDLKMASLARGNMVMNVNASQYLHGNTTFGLAGIYSDVHHWFCPDNSLNFAPLLPLSWAVLLLGCRPHVVEVESRDHAFCISRCPFLCLMYLACCELGFNDFGFLLDHCPLLL